MNSLRRSGTPLAHIPGMLLSALLTIALTGPSSAETPTQGEAQALVKIGDFVLTDLHFALFASQTGRNPADPDGQLNLLNELVNNFMVANSAEGQALVEKPEVKAALEVATARLLAQTFVRAQLEETTISEEALQASYEARYGDGGGTEYRARHILLEDEPTAIAVIAELDGGADFAELARTKSTGPTKRVGGDLGWFEEGVMDPAFSQATAQLDNGKYSATPVKTQFGYHVILREDSRPVTPPTFEEAKETLTQALQQQQIAAAITRIRETTPIEVQAEAQ